MPIDIFNWLGLRGKPKAVRKPHGRTLTHGPSGECIECDTLQCCHCGGHFEVVIGSGRLRGTCLRCDGFVCGAPACMAGCIPFEQRLENLEHGLDILTPRALQVPVTADISPPEDVEPTVLIVPPE